MFDSNTMAEVGSVGALITSGMFRSFSRASFSSRCRSLPCSTQFDAAKNGSRTEKDSSFRPRLAAAELAFGYYRFILLLGDASLILPSD